MTANGNGPRQPPEVGAPTDPAAPARPPRRPIRRVLVVIGGVVLAGLAAGSGLLFAQLGGAEGGTPLSEVPRGVSPASIQFTPMFLWRSGGTVIALRPFSPDSQDAVAWCPAQGFFEDPVTGSKFGPDGRYLAGPAPRGLDRYQSKLVGGVLQVAPDVTIAGGAHGAEVSPLSLPACDWQHAIFAPNVALPNAPPTPEPSG